MHICKGCGIHLQSTDPALPGYTPKENSEYCQRCYRIMHYDDLTVSMKKGIDPDMVIDRIAAMDALIVWVVDLFDFEAGMIPGLNRKFTGKDILLVCAKRDILPDTLSHEKIARFVFARLKEQGISVRGLILTDKVDPQGAQEVKDAVASLAKGRPAVVMGRANSGKSTLLNKMMNQQILTSSRYPGTTLEFNEMTIDGQVYIDTPGIENEGTILMEVDEKDLREILPDRQLKPQVYQLRGDQSFAIGGLARIDIFGCDHASCVFYISQRLPIHRAKAASADGLWQKHRGGMFRPVALNEEMRSFSCRKEYEKMDIVIDGLGWACLSSQASSVTVYVPKGVNVTFRKAML